MTNYDQLHKLDSSSTWDLTIVDEAHYIKNPESQRSRAILRLGQRSGLVAALTGTPVPNYLLELLPLLLLLDPKTWDMGRGSGAAFAQRYCGPKLVLRGGRYQMTYEGATNKEELQERLRSTILIRRLKSQVLKELPAKTWKVLAFPDTGLKNLVQAEQEAFRAGGFTEDMPVEEMRKRKVPFEELSAARKELGVAKVSAVLDHLRAVLREQPKIAVYAHHREVLTALSNELAEFNPAVIRGESTEEMRGNAVARFQTDPACRVFIGSITAAGEGITLTASSYCAFAEPSWSPKDMDQVSDRFHRIGQVNPVLIEVLVIDGSVDANVMKKVLQKVETLKGVLD